MERQMSLSLDQSWTTKIINQFYLILIYLLTRKWNYQSGKSIKGNPTLKFWFSRFQISKMMFYKNTSFPLPSPLPCLLNLFFCRIDALESRLLNRVGVLLESIWLGLRLINKIKKKKPIPHPLILRAVITFFSF